MPGLIHDRIIGRPGAGGLGRQAAAQAVAGEIISVGQARPRSGALDDPRDTAGVEPARTDGLAALRYPRKIGPTLMPAASSQARSARTGQVSRCLPYEIAISRP
jgi:hypothetical protein